MSDPVGAIGSTSVRLAAWLEDEDRYSRRYIPVDPDDDRVATDRFAFGADRQIKVWEQSSWRGGEGERVWRPETSRFWRGQNVRPGRDGDGLVLGPFTLLTRADTNANQVSDVDFNPNSSGTFFIDPSNNQLYWIDDAEYVTFSTAIDTYGGWDGGGAALPGGGASGLNINGDVPAGWAAYSGTLVLLAYPTLDSVFAWDPGGANLGDFWTHPSTSGSSISLIGWAHGRLLARVGNRLYEFAIDATAGTETLLDEVPGSVGAFGVGTDVGAAWLATTNDGKTTVIREFNLGSNTAATTGQLPDRADVLDLAFAFGFLFVLYQPDGDKDLWLYYQRGGIRGVAGPIRLVSGTYDFSQIGASAVPPRFVGPVGSTLMIWYDDALWGYDTRDGAFFLLSETATTFSGNTHVTQIIGPRLFAGEADEVQLWVPAKYTTRDAYLEHGEIDFQYPGLDKILLDVTVITDPLPASTTVNVAVAVDGETSFTTLTGTHSVDGATSFTFTASSNSATISGKRFRIRVIPDSTDEDNTPTIRSVSARATGAAHRIEWVLQIDAGSVGSQDSAALIDALNALAAAGTVVQFSDPWQNPESVSADTFDVTVEEVVTPERYTDTTGDVLATVRLRAVSLV